MPTGVTSSSSSEETVEVEEGSSEEYAPEATAKSAARPKAASKPVPKHLVFSFVFGSLKTCFRFFGNTCFFDFWARF